MRSRNKVKHAARLGRPTRLGLGRGDDNPADVLGMFTLDILVELPDDDHIGLNIPSRHQGGTKAGSFVLEIDEPTGNRDFCPRCPSRIREYDQDNSSIGKTDSEKIK